ncbi:MAG: hypothetical protein RL376_1945 [Verrucomicrobiota bacterium]
MPERGEFSLDAITYLILAFAAPATHVPKSVPPKKNLPHPPRIAVLVDTATDWGRGILTGIHRYSQKHGPWHLFFDPRDQADAVHLAPDWDGDGIIARITHGEIARQLSLRQTPLINVSAIHYKGPQFPRVSNDVEGVARLAVDYFRQRGFRAFAYLSLRGLECVSRQRDAFVAAVEQTGGGSVAVHGISVMPGFHAPDWTLNLEKLGTWLLTLPKPVALFTWSGGREVIYACQKVGLRVPQDVALLSGSDDELVCSLSPVPISGVKADSERIGYEAATQLDALLGGDSRTESTTLIAPLSVITRQSTDTLAINDEKMRSAFHYIHNNLTKPMRISELARSVGLSRSGLERRFRTLVGCAPADYVARNRLERVKALLGETSHSIATVAERTGFSSPEYMTSVFRRRMRVSPLQYRRALRKG